MASKEKLALVTGASSGIGAATAQLLARMNTSVALVARRTDKLEEVAQSIRSMGGRAEVFSADLSDPEAVTAMAEAVRSRMGVPDIIVNNAGAGRWKPLIETTPAEARQMIELPYLAAVYVTCAFLPDLLARGSGHLVSVTSPASYMVWPNACAYIAARHALKGFTDALRAEVAGKGVFVSTVVLGVVESSYWEHNPGSRQHVPKGIRALTTAQAAEAIITAIEKKKKRLVRPALFRLLFALEGLIPGSTIRT